MTYKTSKQLTNGQVCWMMKKGLAWEVRDEEGLVATKDHVYAWTPPHYNLAGEFVRGLWEAI